MSLRCFILTSFINCSHSRHIVFSFKGSGQPSSWKKSSSLLFLDIKLSILKKQFIHWICFQSVFLEWGGSCLKMQQWWQTYRGHESWTSVSVSAVLEFMLSAACCGEYSRYFQPDMGQRQVTFAFQSGFSKLEGRSRSLQVQTFWFWDSAFVQIKKKGLWETTGLNSTLLM